MYLKWNKFRWKWYKKSKDITCPKYGGSIRFEINNYKIKLSESKNGQAIIIYY